MTRRRSKPFSDTAIILTLVAMIGSFLAVAGSVVWAASKIDSRVESIETWIVANKDTQVKLVTAGIEQSVLENNQKEMLRRLERIEAQRYSR